MGSIGLVQSWLLVFLGWFGLGKITVVLKILEEVNESTNQQLFCVDLGLDFIIPITIPLKSLLIPLEAKILALQSAQLKLHSKLCALFMSWGFRRLGCGIAHVGWSFLVRG